jgi:hypothetical protein
VSTCYVRRGARADRAACAADLDVDRRWWGGRDLGALLAAWGVAAAAPREREPPARLEPPHAADRRASVAERRSAAVGRVAIVMIQRDADDSLSAGSVVSDTPGASRVPVPAFHDPWFRSPDPGNRVEARSVDSPGCGVESVRRRRRTAKAGSPMRGHSAVFLRLARNLGALSACGASGPAVRELEHASTVNPPSVDAGP